VVKEILTRVNASPCYGVAQQHCGKEAMPLKRVAAVGQACEVKDEEVQP
jgi:hypothetical protein